MKTKLKANRNYFLFLTVPVIIFVYFFAEYVIDNADKLHLIK